MYEILKNLYDKLQRCLEAHSLELSLMSGMPIEVMAKCEEELEKFCNDAGLPADIKTWYLMTQGQDLERGISGLFGMYSFPHLSAWLTLQVDIHSIPKKSTCSSSRWHILSQKPAEISYPSALMRKDKVPIMWSCLTAK